VLIGGGVGRVTGSGTGSVSGGIGSGSGSGSGSRKQGAGSRQARGVTVGWSWSLGRRSTPSVSVFLSLSVALAWRVYNLISLLLSCLVCCFFFLKLWSRRAMWRGGVREMDVGEQSRAERSGAERHFLSPSSFWAYA